MPEPFTLLATMQSEADKQAFLSTLCTVMARTIQEELQDIEVTTELEGPDDERLQQALTRCEDAVALNGRVILLGRCVERTMHTSQLCEALWRKWGQNIRKCPQRYVEELEWTNNDTIVERWLCILQDELQAFVESDVRETLLLST
jgi:hypothetical protein